MAGQFLAVLCYHSIVPDNASDTSCLRLAQCETKVSRFHEQLQFISEHCTVISAQQLIEWRFRKFELPPNACLLTFDDCIQATIETVVPLLKKHRFPAIFFPTLCSILKKPAPTIFRLYNILDQIEWTELQTIIDRHYDINLKKSSSKAELRINLKHYLLNASYFEAENILTGVEKVTNIAHIPFGYFPSTQSLELLHYEGLEIGGHAIRHAKLTKISAEEAAEEISLCQSTVKNITGSSPQFFCYPFGGRGSWNAQIEDILRQNGFTHAFTTCNGFMNKRLSQYQLPRISIADQDVDAFQALITMRRNPLQYLRNFLPFSSRIFK